MRLPCDVGALIGGLPLGNADLDFALDCEASAVWPGYELEPGPALGQVAGCCQVCCFVCADFVVALLQIAKLSFLLIAELLSLGSSVSGVARVVGDRDLVDDPETFPLARIHLRLRVADLRDVFANLARSRRLELGKLELTAGAGVDPHVLAIGVTSNFIEPRTCCKTSMRWDL